MNPSQHCCLAIGALLRAVAADCTLARSPRRVLLIGVDGADPGILERLIGEGRLPSFARLKAAGASGPLRSREPLLSPILWTTSSVLPIDVQSDGDRSPVRTHDQLDPAANQSEPRGRRRTPRHVDDRPARQVGHTRGTWGSRRALRSDRPLLPRLTRCPGGALGTLGALRSRWASDRSSASGGALRRQLKTSSQFEAVTTSIVSTKPRTRNCVAKSTAPSGPNGDGWPPMTPRPTTCVHWFKPRRNARQGGVGEDHARRIVELPVDGRHDEVSGRSRGSGSCGRGRCRSCG